ncbi:hypothetical protein [Streptomyces mirabilis]|uniref:hypothetical protein n=1 Tax=Streptomyces mirabilis TaxID=68239 RepID=UPI0033278A7E
MTSRGPRSGPRLEYILGRALEVECGISHLMFEVLLILGRAGERGSPCGPSLVLSGEVVLSSGGQVIDRTTDPLNIGFTVPGAAKRYYILAARTTRTADWTTLATRSTVTWGFTSARPRGSTSSALPLLTVRTGGAVDLNSTAPADHAFRIPLTVQRPTSAERSAVTRLSLQVSYDDGHTWKTVHVTRHGTTGSALLHHPSRTGYVSLQISAADKAGNTVTQTVIRAYRIATAR